MSARQFSSEPLDLTKEWTGSVDINSVIPNPDQPRRYFD